MDKESKEKVPKSDELVRENKELELARKEFNKLTTQRLERYDRWRRSRSTFENATNWLLAINIGTLFLLIGSFGKFVVSGVMPIKGLFLLSAFFLAFSVIAFAFCRGILYLREFGINKALEDIEGLPDRVDLKTKNKTKEESKEMKEELVEMVEGIFDRSGTLWRALHNLITYLPPLIISGLASYILGVLLLAVYILIFIAKYV